MLNIFQKEIKPFLTHFVYFFKIEIKINKSHKNLSKREKHPCRNCPNRSLSPHEKVPEPDRASGFLFHSRLGKPGPWQNSYMGNCVLSKNKKKFLTKTMFRFNEKITKLFILIKLTNFTILLLYFIWEITFFKHIFHFIIS